MREQARPDAEVRASGVALLDGKRILVTGVLNHRSIAYAVAERLQHHGADLVLTTPPQVVRHTRKAAATLPVPCEVLELDVMQPGQLEGVVAALHERWGGIDGVLHAIAFAPRSCLGDSFLAPEWEDVATTLQISSYSLNLLARVAVELADGRGASIVGLDFDARVAWPVYNWMGVAKATLESVARYLAQELGPRRIRVNLIAAGPVRTLSARAIPGFPFVEGFWDSRAPLGWDARDPGPIGDACVALFSDLLSATTGEIIHVDGGAHAVGVGNELGAPPEI